VTRERLERIAAGATVLRSRIVAQLKRRSGQPAEALENLLQAIDNVLAVLELEAVGKERMN
jgi:hypothetical protein